jgi:predicted RNA-binding protein YlxR (DUF448 family)
MATTMPRARPQVERTPLRRCFVTGESAPKAGLIRFVVTPDGAVVPDLAETLPGRGLWLSAEREVIATACRGNRFARALRRPVHVDPALPAVIEAQLAERCCNRIRLARRAGAAVFGYDRVRAWLATLVDGGQGAVLLLAADADHDAAARLGAGAATLQKAQALTAAELGRCFNRERVVYAGVAGGPLAQRVLREVSRLAGLRAAPTAGSNARHVNE